MRDWERLGELTKWWAFRRAAAGCFSPTVWWKWVAGIAHPSTRYVPAQVRAAQFIDSIMPMTKRREEEKKKGKKKQRREQEEKRRWNASSTYAQIVVASLAADLLHASCDMINHLISCYNHKVRVAYWLSSTVSKQRHQKERGKRNKENKKKLKNDQK